jgi:hypothetical protein
LDIFLRRTSRGREGLDHDAVSFLPREPGDNVADVLVRAGDDLVAAPQPQPVADDAGAFGGIARIGDFVGVAAEYKAGLVFDLRP